MAAGLLRLVSVAAALCLLVSVGAVYATEGTSGGSAMSPATNASLDGWGLGPDGMLTTATVAWTPVQAGSYTVQVVVKGRDGATVTSGTAIVTAAGVAARADTISFPTPGADPADVYGVSIIILQVD